MDSSFLICLHCHVAFLFHMAVVALFEAVLLNSFLQRLPLGRENVSRPTLADKNIICKNNINMPVPRGRARLQHHITPPSRGRTPLFEKRWFKVLRPVYYRLLTCLQLTIAAQNLTGNIKEILEKVRLFSLCNWF